MCIINYATDFSQSASRINYTAIKLNAKRSCGLSQLFSDG